MSGTQTFQILTSKFGEHRAALWRSHIGSGIDYFREPIARLPPAHDDDFHSITSSAVASSVGGMVRPSILAVWALMTNSNLLACTTGKSAGLAPLRMRPA